MARTIYIEQDDDDVHFVQEHHAYRGSWIFIVLVHWNNSLHVNMLTHSDTLTWFQDNQSLLLHLNAVCLYQVHHVMSVIRTHNVNGNWHWLHRSL